MNERVKLQLEIIETNLKTLRLMIEDSNVSLDPVKAITDIRKMESMQMIEELLKGHKSDRTNRFITGLKEHAINRPLTESQRFHLESAFSDFRNNSES